MTHICVGKLTIIGSDNGLSPDRRQAIIWTNDGILLIEPLGTNFSEILIGIHTFLFKKMHFKMSSGKWWRFCLGLNVLNETDSPGSDLWPYNPCTPKQWLKHRAEVTTLANGHASCFLSKQGLLSMKETSNAGKSHWWKLWFEIQSTSGRASARNSIANALELRLPCINPGIY